MGFRALCITDLHIHDADSCSLAQQACERAIAELQPDIVLCLGDIFDGRRALEALGPAFHAALRRLHSHWAFVFGNHDGGATSQGGNEEGPGAFAAVFGSPLQVHTAGGRRFITLANAQPDSGWEAFALAQVQPGAVVLTHDPLPPALAETLAARGARLILSGHQHLLRRTPCRTGRCEAWILPPFLFGGVTGDPAGYAVLDFAGDDRDSLTLAWQPQALPPMPGAAGVVPGPAQPPAYRCEAPSALAPWCEIRPAQFDAYTFFGGVGQAAAFRGRDPLWTRQFGRSLEDCCVPQVVEHRGSRYLILGGTWVKAGAGRPFASLVVADPFTGAERYRVPVVGVSAKPCVVDGILYIAGQWRELIAVDLPSGRELWRRRCQVETADTRDLSWYDGHTGGGWTTCSPAVGRHVWCLNARGDLFAFDPLSGAERSVHPAAIPVNALPACPYGNRLACTPERFSAGRDQSGGRVWTVNGQAFADADGRRLPPATVTG